MRYQPRRRCSARETRYITCVTVRTISAVRTGSSISTISTRKLVENKYIVASLYTENEQIGDFEYEIDNKFFENFEFSEVQKGCVKVNLNVEKHERESILTFNFAGSVIIACDRCNDEYEQPIENEVVIYLKYGHEYEEESDDVIVIPSEEGEYDISSLIYEYIILSLPIHRVHQDINDCNQEVIEF